MDTWNPKFLEKTKGSLSQHEEEVVTSVPVYSMEAGDVGNAETNLLWPEGDPRMNSYLSVSQGRNHGEMTSMTIPVTVLKNEQLH